jgi:hypothetical protein
MLIATANSPTISRFCAVVASAIPVLWRVAA